MPDERKTKARQPHSRGKIRYAVIGLGYIAQAAVLLRFPGERLANLTCSFGAAGVSAYEVVGTTGVLRMDPAYELAEALKQRVTIGNRAKSQTFRKRDQFAPELAYFSNRILKGKQPSGFEGMADVRIIEALYRSARTAQPVALDPLSPPRRPAPEQEDHRAPVEEPELVHVESPSR